MTTSKTQRIALCGASGTGKTTLARALADRLAIPYHDGSFGRIARTLGYDAVAPMSVAERMTMQERCLTRYAEEVAALEGGFVTDRSSLDLVGYMLAEVGMHDGTDPGVAERMTAYVTSCVDLAPTLYDAVLLLTPLRSYETTSHRPPANAAYQMHIQLLIEAALGRTSPDLERTRLPSADVESRVGAALAAMEGFAIRGHGRRRAAVE